MRKVVYGGACSLDGFLAGPAGELDWLHFSADVAAEMQARWASVDTLIFGRKTWEDAVVRSGGSSSGGGAMPGVSAYVCSRTLTAVPDGAPTLVGDAAAFVRELKGRPGKDIVLMSGGNLARSLFEADLVDEVGFNIHPVLLGAGVPALLDAGRRVPLELTQCRQMDGGCVLVLYTVRRGAGAAAATARPKAARARRAGR